MFFVLVFGAGIMAAVTSNAAQQATVRRVADTERLLSTVARDLAFDASVSCVRGGVRDCTVNQLPDHFIAGPSGLPLRTDAVDPATLLATSAVANDAWGAALGYCLAASDPVAGTDVLFAIVSPGPDGKFDHVVAGGALDCSSYLANSPPVGGDDLAVIVTAQDVVRMRSSPLTGSAVTAGATSANQVLVRTAASDTATSKSRFQLMDFAAAVDPNFANVPECRALNQDLSTTRLQKFWDAGSHQWMGMCPTTDPVLGTVYNLTPCVNAAAPDALVSCP